MENIYFLCETRFELICPVVVEAQYDVSYQRENKTKFSSFTNNNMHLNRGSNITFCSSIWMVRILCSIRTATHVKKSVFCAWRLKCVYTVQNTLKHITKTFTCIHCIWRRQLHNVHSYHEYLLWQCITCLLSAQILRIFRILVIWKNKNIENHK